MPRTSTIHAAPVVGIDVGNSTLFYRTIATTL
jgi:hypothetical protein